MPNAFSSWSYWNLLVLVILNLVTLGYLIGRLLKLGNNISGALRGAWLLVVGSKTFDRIYRIPMALPWIGPFKKFWWLTMGLTVVFWVFFPSLAGSILMGGFVLLHILWYRLSLQVSPEKFNQMIHLNTNWGIVFQEIESSSNLNKRSLAELDLRKKNLLVLAVERNGQFFPFPKGLETLTVGDRVYIFGDLESYHAIITREEPPADSSEV